LIEAIFDVTKGIEKSRFASFERCKSHERRPGRSWTVSQSSAWTFSGVFAKLSSLRPFYVWEFSFQVSVWGWLELNTYSFYVGFGFIETAPEHTTWNTDGKPEKYNDFLCL